jgi:carboxypeptidase family protein
MLQRKTLVRIGALAGVLAVGIFAAVHRPTPPGASLPPSRLDGVPDGGLPSSAAVSPPGPATPEGAKRTEIAPAIDAPKRQTATIRGTVVDAESGEPVAGVLVNPIGPGQMPRSAGPFGLEKDRSRADGTFELSEVVPGRLRLRAIHSAYPELRTDEIEVAGGTDLDGMVVRLARGGGLEGIVPGEGGLPWTEADVFVLPELGHAEVFRHATRTDSAGCFSVRGVEPGRYRVKALPPRRPGDTGQSREAGAQIAFATVVAGRMTRVEFPGPTRGCTLVGRVLRGTEGVPGVRVVLRPARSRLRPDEFPWDGETGDGGAFVFRNVPPGEATVSVWGDRDDPINAAFPIKVPDAPRFEVSCRLPGGEIAGSVVRAEDGAPIEGVDIQVRPEAFNLDGADLRRPGSANTDAQGRYRVVGLAPGVYEVCAFDRSRQADARAAESRNRVDVAEGSPVEVDFSLAPGARARIAVVDPQGRPVESAYATLRLSSGMEDMREWRWTARTGPDGAAMVVGLVPGRFYVAVRTPDDRVAFSEDREVNREAEGEFRVEVGEGTLVRVRMADEEGERVDGGCTFTDARGRRAMGRFIAQGPPDVAGALVASLPPGEWTVRAMANGYGVHTLPLRVEAGGPVDVPVGMTRAPRWR